MTSSHIPPYDRDGNGNSVQGWTRAIVTLGVPSVIALYAMWRMIDTLPDIQQQLHAHTQLSVQSAQDLRQHVTDSSLANTAVMRVLTGICLNTSRTNEDRKRCLDAR